MGCFSLFIWHIIQKYLWRFLSLGATFSTNFSGNFKVIFHKNEVHQKGYISAPTLDKMTKFWGKLRYILKHFLWKFGLSIYCRTRVIVFYTHCKNRDARCFDKVGCTRYTIQSPMVSWSLQRQEIAFAPYEKTFSIRKWIYLIILTLWRKKF